jgi:hypothetical protein
VILKIKKGSLLSMDPPVLIRIPSTESRNIHSWHSCCFTMDKSFVMYLVQTCIGGGLLIFSAYRLSTEPNCDRASPYWGLIGTICGFFFKSVSNSPSVNRRPAA